ncbi:MAG: glycosyltransferase family 39 protein [Candidatus Zixiibacteriota bacterium]|jgi:4-amino-4-deoxy-L-arabinose transferase-like glycosyltransferase
MTDILKKKRALIILGALSLFLVFYGISALSFTDPDDVFYAETAREMLTHGDPLIPHIFEQPQFEKPPLFYWSLALSFEVLGANAAAARLVTGLVGLLGIVGTFLFLRRLLNQSVALLSSFVLVSSLGWLGLSRSVVTDLMFTVFISFAIYSFFLWYRLDRRVYLWLFAIFGALASLAKSPVGLVIALLVSVLTLAFNRESKRVRRFLFHPWWLLYLVLTLPWYVYVAIKYGHAFLWEYFINDHWNRVIMAEHASFDHLYFYVAVITVAMLPWTGYMAFIGANFRKYRAWYKLIFAWIAVMALLVAIPHSKLATYVSPIYPPLAIGIGIGLYEGSVRFWRRSTAAFITILTAVLAAAPVFLAKTQYPEFFYPALATFGVLSLCAIVASVMLLISRLKTALLINAAGVLVFTFAAITTVMPKLETAVTDSDLPAIVSQYNYTNKPIACTKTFARGAYFYTGDTVLVLADSPNPFWSKHPLRVLNTDDEVRSFFGQYDTLLCVVSNGRRKQLDSLFAGTRENVEISRNLNRCVLLSEKIFQPAIAGKPGPSQSMLVAN